MQSTIIIRRIGIAGIVIITTYASLLATRPAAAVSPEDAYIAARDAAIKKITAAGKAETHGPTEGTSDKIIAMGDKALADLTAQMRAIIGPIAIPGFTDQGAVNLDALDSGDEGFGMLDGLAFGPVDAKTRVIVTTKSLFRRWLAAHKNWYDNAPLPQDPATAVKDETFYTQAVMTDAAIFRLGDLPVHKPDGAAFAFAMLTSRSQDGVPDKAEEIFVAVAQDGTAPNGRVFVANSTEFTAVGPIASCDALRAKLTKDAEDAAQKHMSQDKIDALSAKVDTDFQRCFRDNASKQGGFDAATRAAQALLDRLPLH